MTDIYQKLLLVNHIPAIEGIAGIQNLIKAFAYRGDLYMEKAKQFSQLFYQVLQDIRNIKIKNESIRDVNGFNWCDIPRKYLDDKNIFESRFCCTCGDYYYTMLYYRKNKPARYPRCKCNVIYWV